jgi:uncharacterized protein (DUF2141 family)
MIQFISIWLIMSIAVLSAQDSSDMKNTTGNLSLIIVGFKNDEGTAKVALCASEESYSSSDTSFHVASLVIKEKRVEYIFENIPFGEYAIKVFHDRDNDNKLNKNFLGAPTEDYGFSNNVRGTFGPPKWKDAKFFFNSATSIMQIVVK